MFVGYFGVTILVNCMMIADILVVLIIMIAVAWAIFSIVNARKKGKHCMGCPYSGACSGKTCEENTCAGDRTDSKKDCGGKK